MAPPSVLPDISPTRGEIRLIGRPTSIRVIAKSFQSAESLISPLVGEMSGRTEGGAKDRDLDSASRKRLA
jgi:precorrin-3B synthase